MKSIRWFFYFTKTTFNWLILLESRYKTIKDCVHVRYSFTMKYFKYSKLSWFKIKTQYSVGFFCIYIAHVMFGYEYPLLLNMNNNGLVRFANHMH